MKHEYLNCCSYFISSMIEGWWLSILSFHYQEAKIGKKNKNINLDEAG